MQETDSLDFLLAETLALPLRDVQDLPNAEVVAWRSYFQVRAAMEDLHARTQNNRRGR